MRHRKAHSLNNRFSSWRKATLKSLARNLLVHQSITTTAPRASSVQPLVEKMISLAKENTLSAKRKVYALLGDHKLVSILFNEIGPRFANRGSGYTRILGLGLRRGDGAELALLELTEIKKKETRKPKKSKETKRADDGTGQEIAPQEISGEKKAKPDTAVKGEKPILTKKPHKKFLGGIRSIFKKERDAL